MTATEIVTRELESHLHEAEAHAREVSRLLALEVSAHQDTRATCKALERAYKRVTQPDETYGHQARRILRTLGLDVTPERETYLAKELLSVAELARNRGQL